MAEFTGEKERDNNRDWEKPKDNIAKVDMIMMDFLKEGSYIIFTIFMYTWNIS